MPVRPKKGSAKEINLNHFRAAREQKVRRNYRAEISIALGQQLKRVHEDIKRSARICQKRENFHKTIFICAG